MRQESMKGTMIGLSLLLPMMAQATIQTQYLAIGYQSSQYKDDELAPKIDENFGNIYIKSGTYLQKDIAFEANIVVGLEEKEVPYEKVMGSASLQHVISLLFRKDIQLGDSVNLYGLAGASNLSVKRQHPDEDDQEKLITKRRNRTSVSVGLGIETKIYRDVYVHLEAAYYQKDYQALNFGFSYKL
ncbi:outer membrane beta-barrel protein [Algicola sagamiensis]|uniref:outer membrane beta-barrel protein n=1 Tax=Algicola sagamiensis TaxID=163869 RepID=UPI00039D3AB8|nr:outer membrane beta-barrel protein [Algicola sagamiensis]